MKIHRKRRAPSRRLSAFAEALEPRCLLAANLVISEFLASNDDSIADSFGGHEDWLEVYNAGDAAANLNDYFLTDSAGNPEKWRFPVQSLAAGAHIIVFASDRNLAVAGQELHTNFALSAGGEYLALIRAADSTPQFEYAPSYPVQSTDISYGLSDSTNPASQRIYFSVPTPGALNALSVNTPAYSVAGKTFNGSMQVGLSSTTPGASIRYTTDNSAPTASSTLYTGPINLTASTAIRAKAFAAGYVDSPVASETYIAVDATVSTFRSNLPIVVLESFNQTFDDQTMVNASAAFIDTGADNYADMLDPVNFAGRIGLRYRGSTSFSNYPKKQFAVEIRDESNNDRSAPILGLPSESDWVIYAPWTERSLMNNALAMDWARQMGHYASRVRFVEVYLNNDADGAVNFADDYLGVYILMEKPKLDSNRVDVDEVLPTATTEPEITGGYMFKKDRKESTEIAIDTTGGAQVPSQRFVMVEPAAPTSPQLTYLTNYLNELDGVMNGANYADPVNGYAKYIDVDSWVDYWILAEFTKNIDGFWLSTFYFKPQGGTIHMGPVWDFNLAFGQVNYRDGSSVSGYNSDSLGTLSGFGWQYGYFSRLFQDPTFKLKVADRWQELRETVFNTTKISAEIDTYVAQLTDNNGNYPEGTSPNQSPANPAARNFLRWPVLGVYSTTNSYFDPLGRWIEDINLMKAWIKGRAEWLDTQFIPAPVLSPTGGAFGSPTSVSMTPKSQATFTDTSLMGASYGVNYLVPSSTLSGWQNLGYPTAGWTGGTITTGKGVGYDTTTTPVNYASLISVNVQSPMQNVRSSIYTRFAINIANPATVDHLILKMKYDDAFYAWFNGVRIIEGSVGENSVPAFNTTASAERNEALATQYVEWDISEIKNTLVAGVNILAIQGVNRSASNNDLLIVPELFTRTYTVGTPAAPIYYTTDGSDPRDPVTGNPSATALQYSGPLSINSTRHIRARTLISTGPNVWSGIADEIYDFDANVLRVTEIMYNASAGPIGSPYTAQDFEYIEVRNTGASSLNLAGFSFSAGITFTFPNVVLAPGAYGVVVKLVAAFQSRYGLSPLILGQYTGNLDNGGEAIAISNGSAQVTHSFTYDDIWYPETDGPGYALVIRNPLGALPAWDNASAWRPSEAPQGLPGVDDTDTTAPTLVSTLYDPATREIRFTFSEPVSFSSGSTVTELLTSANISNTPSTSSTVIKLLLASPVAAGLYRGTLSAPAVTDFAAHALATDSVFTFVYVPSAQTLALPLASGARVVNQITIEPSARLDITNNALILDYAPTATSPLPTIKTHLLTGRGGTGFANAPWNGPGINSSSAAAQDQVSFAIGYVDNSFLPQLGMSSYTSFFGQSVDSTSVLVRYTKGADTNLDGRVNTDDVTIVGALYNQAGTGDWFFGDFDYDGIVDTDDVTVLGAMYDPTAPALAAASFADRVIGEEEEAGGANSAHFATALLYEPV